MTSSRPSVQLEQLAQRSACIFQKSDTVRVRILGSMMNTAKTAAYLLGDVFPAVLAFDLVFDDRIGGKASPEQGEEKQDEANH